MLALLCLACPALVALPPGIIAWTLGTRDLALMDNGVMDARGRAQTILAKKHGRAGVALSVTAVIIHAIVFLTTR